MPKLQGKLHWPDCKCIQCAKFFKVCECCSKEFTSYPAYRRHQTAKPRQKRGAKDQHRAAIVPDGLGFLERVLANQKTVQKYNLSVISRFCAALNDMRGGNPSGKFTRSHKRMLKELQESETNTLMPFDILLPSTQAGSVLKLAQSVNVSPQSVLCLLVQYGLEHLATELRTNSVAPPIGNPNVKKELVQERQSAAQEFLEEEPKIHEVTTYSTPTNKPSDTIRSYLIPSSTKKEL